MLINNVLLFKKSYRRIQPWGELTHIAVI